MIVCVDETRRYDQSSRIDHTRPGRNLDLTAFTGGDNRVVLQKNNGVCYRTTA